MQNNKKVALLPVSDSESDSDDGLNLGELSAQDLQNMLNNNKSKPKSKMPKGGVKA